MLAVNGLGDIGSSLREGFFMFWETLWALVLGFGLSGAVQAFVPKEQMERVMGNHGPAAVTRARSGAAVAPVERTAWQRTQPLALNTFWPATGSPGLSAEPAW